MRSLILTVFALRPKERSHNANCSSLVPEKAFALNIAMSALNLFYFIRRQPRPSPEVQPQRMCPGSQVNSIVYSRSH